MIDVPPLDAEAMGEARRRQGALTKPPGSLGLLEELAVTLAGAQAAALPSARPAGALIFAADHPVTRHGVSPYPSEVTAAMVRNFVSGAAAASVLARARGVPLHVVDVGVRWPDASAPPAAEGFVREAVAGAPAGDLRVEDAMSPDVFEACREAGRRAATRLSPGLRVLVLGEMGIGNTTAAAAVAAALAGLAPEEAIGAGTGADLEMRARKAAVVRDALARLGGERGALEVLRKVGGRELAALTGAAEAAAERGAVVLVDGFIVTAAMLALVRARPSVRPRLVFAHRSAERAHGALLARLEARPLLDLGMRLGEGSGALAAFPLLEDACALHREMATFDEARVPNLAPDREARR